jgi:hypothetical protein
LIGFCDLKRRIRKFREQINEIPIDSKSNEFHLWVEQQRKIKQLVINQTIFLFDAKVFNLTFLKGKILIRVL